MLSSRSRRRSIAAASFAACSGLALAAGHASPELTGSWIGGSDTRVIDPCTGLVATFSFAGSWSDNANWSSGDFPDGESEIAIIGQPRDRLGDVTIDMLQPIQLAGLVLSNNRGVQIQSSDALGGINSTAGLVIQSTGGLPEIDARFADRVGSLNFGSRIQVPISGGTLTVSGAAPVWLASTNSFEHLRISGGIVTLADTAETGPGQFPTPVISQNQLGAGSITLDGGTLRVFSDRTPGTVLTPLSKNIVLGAGGGTLVTSSELGEITGVISGSGTLNTVVRTATAVNFRLANNMTYTGPTHVRAGTLTIGGAAGRISATTAINNNATLIIANGNSVNIDRVNNAAPYSPGSAVLVVSSDVPYSETMGDLLPQGGLSSIVITAPAEIGSSTLTFGTLTRNNRRGGLYFTGRNLGTLLTGTLSTHIHLGNGTSLLVGNGGSATSAGIIPFAWGATANSNVIGDGGGTGSFVTYGATGVRPLDLASEYVQSVAASTNPNDNVRVTASEVSFGKGIGALLLGSGSNLAAGTPSTLTINGLLTLHKGVLLNTTQGNTINGVGGITSAGPNFELNIFASSANSPSAGLNINAPIINNGANPVSVTRLGPGSVFFNAISAYSGDTIIGGGRTYFSQNVASGASGPFGNATSAIIIYSTGASIAPIQTRLLTNTDGLTFGRPLSIRGASAGGISTGVLLGTFTDNVNTTWTGAWDVGADVQLFISGNNTLANSITGTGLIRDNFVPTFPDMDITFAGNNSGFTGSWWIVLAPPVTNGTVGERFVFNPGAVNPLGTGTVYIDSTPIFVSNAPTTLGGQWVVMHYGLGQFSGPAKTTLTGPVNLGGIRGDIRVGSGASATTAGELEISGSMFGGTFVLRGVGIGTSSAYSLGTLTLSGNNSGMTGAIHLGVSVTPPGNCNPLIPEVPAGVLRIVSSGGLGNESVMIKAEDSTLQLAGNISLNANNRIFIAGDGVGVGAAALGSIHNAAGNNTLAGDIIFNDHVANSLAVNTSQTIRVESGSTLTHTGLIYDQTTGSGPTRSAATLIKTGGGTLSLRRIITTADTAPNPDARVTLTGVSVQAGTLRVLPSAINNDPDSLSAVTALLVQPGARLDLGNNSMVVDYTSASLRAVLEFWLASGFAAGSWTGPGIGSSAGNAQQFTLGIAEATETPYSGTYLGHDIDNTTAIIRFTRYGDTDLNGITNLNDFSRLAVNFNQPGRWATGDFNYDGSVTIADFALLAGNFNLTTADTPRASTVPEAGSLSLVLAAGLQCRRRAAVRPRAPRRDSSTTEASRPRSIRSGRARECAA